jgi:hypothetical protein
LYWNLFIKPGLETRQPWEAVRRYQACLAEKGRTLKDQRVLVFGYGGNLLVGCGLLRSGAAHLVMVEQPGFPYTQDLRSLHGQFPDYFVTRLDGSNSPDPKYFTLVHGEVTTLASQQSIDPVDLVLTSSVFEHLKNVDETTKALAALTSPDGAHLHFIDLRDHFFKYPFEMLSYSQNTWERWINPGSNLNRFRLPMYKSVFARYFQDVDIDTLERDIHAFIAAKKRIRLEFLSGVDQDDAITLLQVFASRPTVNANSNNDHR